MADAIVRDEPGLDLVTGSSPVPIDTDRVPKTAESGPSRSNAVAVAVGLGSAAILFVYFFVGSVRIEAGPRSGVRYRIETVWSDFVGYLMRQGVNSEFIIVVGALAAFSVLGSCVLIGLAFATRDDSLAE